MHPFLNDFSGSSSSGSTLGSGGLGFEFSTGGASTADGVLVDDLVSWPLTNPKHICKQDPTRYSNNSDVERWPLIDLVRLACMQTKHLKKGCLERREGTPSQ